MDKGSQPRMPENEFGLHLQWPEVGAANTKKRRQNGAKHIYLKFTIQKNGTSGICKASTLQPNY